MKTKESRNIFFILSRVHWSSLVECHLNSYHSSHLTNLYENDQFGRGGDVRRGTFEGGRSKGTLQGEKGKLKGGGSSGVLA